MNNKDNWMKLPHPKDTKDLALWQRMENQARLIELTNGSYVAVKSMLIFAAEVKALENKNRWHWHKIGPDRYISNRNEVLHFQGKALPNGGVDLTHWRKPL